MASSDYRRPLVLHFDVNKTIIICDAAAGVSLDEMLNSLLSECCWGPRPAALEAAQDPATLSPPEKHAIAVAWAPTIGPSTEPPDDASLITFSDLLEGELCMTKAPRKRLKKTFTDPGCVGERFRGTYDSLRTAMTLPDGVNLPKCAVERPGQADDAAHGDLKSPTRFHFILPSFFRMAQALHADGRRFSIVFRTFGVDLPEILGEWNAFCSGKHPLWPHVRMDGADGRPDRRVVPPHGTGAWTRFAGPRGAREAPIALSVVDRATGVVRVARGAKACASAIDEQTQDGRTLGLQDDWAHWNAQGEADDAGKLLLVTDPAAARGAAGARAALSAPHHIFFDDNVERTRAHIIDVRCRLTGRTVPFERARGVWLVRSEPLHAIRDPRYFLDAVDRCERSLDAVIERHAKLRAVGVSSAAAPGSPTRSRHGWTEEVQEAVMLGGSAGR
jgi:hypothetical protein